MFPDVILLFSGKRKSGKDYLTDRLENILGRQNCTIIKISHPIKSHWAKTLNLDLDQLLSDGEYKEKYRLEMINWSDSVRKENYGYFCRSACDDARGAKIWIVSDIRRKTDIKWFRETYGSKVKTVKVVADDDVRKSRGWTFTTGVDDVVSECDLDDVTEWDYLIDNNDPSVDVKLKLKELLNSLEPEHD